MCMLIGQKPVASRCHWTVLDVCLVSPMVCYEIIPALLRHKIRGIKVLKNRSVHLHVPVTVVRITQSCLQAVMRLDVLLLCFGMKISIRLRVCSVKDVVRKRK